MIKFIFYARDLKKLEVTAPNLFIALEVFFGLKLSTNNVIALSYSGIKLYFADELFKNFVENPDLISEEEIIELCLCTGIYENNEDYYRENSDIVEKGSLWAFYQNKMTLINVDYHAETSLNEEFFTRII